MNDAYKTDTIKQHGSTYLIEWFYDHDCEAPWDREDIHGPVSDWERRDKRPGEFILNESRGGRRFYDFAKAMKTAKEEQWNTAPYDWKTPGEQAHAAVMADFEYLRRWCNDQWHYCGIVVTLLDDDGEKTDSEASLWGVEDDGYLSNGYHSTVIQDLIGDCDHQTNRTTYPVTHCGI